MEKSSVGAAPVVDADGRYLGVVRLTEPDGIDTNTIDDTYTPIHQSVHLDAVLETLTSTPQTWAAVIDDQRHVVGTISISDIVRNYRRTMQTNLQRVSEHGGSTGISEILVDENSTIVGKRLRDSAAPRGVLITAIERGRDIIRPTGDTTVSAGDRLMALGSTDDLTLLHDLASAK